MNAPMAAAPMSLAARAPGASAEFAAKARMQPQEAKMAEAQVRSNFAETAYWSPAVVTNNGSATLQVTFPDSLTRWHASARGLTQNAQVGAGDSDVETKKNLLVRLQAPRFFVERDEAVLTANVQNYLKTAKRVRVSLNLSSATAGLPVPLSTLPKSGIITTGTNLGEPVGEVTVPAGGEARINWVVKVTRDGAAKIRMSAQTDEEADAVEMKFPVLVHGVQRFASQSGVLNNSGTQSITIQMPKARRLGASRWTKRRNSRSIALRATRHPALPKRGGRPCARVCARAAGSAHSMAG